jgi:cytochrome c-type biogenesis protein
MGSGIVTIPAAFLAGLLSFFSPCVLPLVPAYLGYLTGASVTGADASQRGRTMVHAALFVLGFGLIFVSLGAAAGLLGRALYPILPHIMRIGGVILIVLGLHIAGLITIPFLMMEKRVNARLSGGTMGSSFLIGVVFAAGWTPCIGPVLAAILMLAADSQTVTQGGVLLAVYTLGLGVPFLLAAWGLEAALPWLRGMNRYMGIIKAVSGALLMLMGFLLLTGLFTPLMWWLNSLMAPPL